MKLRGDLATLGEIEKVFEKANEWVRSGWRVCLATVIEARGSTPRSVGAKMVISSSGETFGTVGGGEVEKKVLEAAPGVMKTGRTAIVEFDLSGESADIDALCGGNLRVFLEPLGEYRGLFIIGAGHVGRALAVSASAVGFAVTLVDDREEFLHGEGLPGTVRTVRATPADFGEKLDMDADSFAVIATRGHALDKEWLGAVSGIGLRYVGMVGSRRKVESVFAALRREGVSDEFLEKVHSPVGLNIGAETPAEIAVSITAELIEVLHGGEQ
jgi:xanthine dehydrogenase accessory factor